jgi:hypothetical protein
VPVRPTGKGRLKVGKAFVSGEGRNGKWSKERSWAESLCVRSESRIQVHINLWRAVIGEILMLTWGATLGWNFDLTLGVLHERHSEQRGMCVPTQNLLQGRGKL